MTTATSNLKSFEGLGQLEAYADAEEGVAFQMDNQLIWDCLGEGRFLAIEGVPVKKKSSKFYVIGLPSGKVRLTDRTGMYLAPIPTSGNPSIYPLRLVPTPEHTSSQFEVFYRGNKVAFRAYNGLFLARVYRGFHTIEAAEDDDEDDSCLFLPLIGDIHVPTFEILEVIFHDASTVECYPCVIRRERVTNRSRLYVNHTFSITWKTTVTDRVAWKYLWGLGFANSCEVKVNGMTIKLKYTEDNERLVFVTRHIYEKHRKEVLIPPKSVCTARLLVYKKDSASCTFTAIIRKVKSDGDVIILHQPGAWAGLIYHDIYMDIETERFPN